MGERGASRQERFFLGFGNSAGQKAVSFVWESTNPKEALINLSKLPHWLKPH